MREIEKVFKQSFALTGKLHNLILELICHPDLSKIEMSLMSLQKRLSNLDKFIFDYSHQGTQESPGESF